MSNGNIRHVEATFDMLLRHVAGVDGALLTDVKWPRSKFYAKPRNAIVTCIIKKHFGLFSGHTVEIRRRVIVYSYGSKIND